jgi:hypothetical protein
MKKGKFLLLCIFSVSAILSDSCDYYLGMNQQPDFGEDSIYNGLNIFGLLRPDSIQNYNKSFVFVQQIWPALEYESFTIIKNAEVSVEHVMVDSSGVIAEFPMMPADSLFPDTLYRPVEYFSPQAGEAYRLVCHSEGFPDAIGETVIPSEARIIENSLVINGRAVSFTLADDSLIKMLDIYLVNNDEYWYLSRVVPLDGVDTDVELELPVAPAGMMLKIFSYDTHLAAYYGNANTSLNFNKYRTTITTLESGYGVFGALNFVLIPINNN